MKLSSVDLCAKGANQHAHIKLFKSKEGGEEMNFWEKIGKAFGKVIENEITDEIKEIVNEKENPENEAGNITKAMGESLKSILNDTALTASERDSLIEQSINEFNDEINKARKRWKDKDDDTYIDDYEYEDDPEDEELEKKRKCRKSMEGSDTMPVIDIEKMSAEDKAILENLERKYSNADNSVDNSDVHPEVKKALDEMETLKSETAELKKSLEIKQLEAEAKKYEIIGKSAEDLAVKFYELKKSGENVYNDYVSLLDEQVELANNSIFKEYGSSKSKSYTDLDGIVSEILKSNPNMTQAQAVVKAYQDNPELDRYTGKMK